MRIATEGWARRRFSLGASAAVLAIGLAAPVAAQLTGQQSSDPGNAAAPAAAVQGGQPVSEAKARAATGVAADQNGIADIVVTAQFREQKLQDVPIAISAVNAEGLAQRSVQNLTDIARAVPNVEMTAGDSGFGANTNQAFIRGLGQQDFLTTFEPRVGFYIDDVYFSTTFGAVFDVLDLDRVEVLRGPQGTLFGRNSVGGAIRIISKKPQGDNSGYVEATGGSYHHYQFRGAYDFALVPDVLMVRLAGNAKGENGWIDLLDYKCVHPDLGNARVGKGGQGPANGNSCKRGTLGGDKDYNFRGSVRFVPSDRIEFLLQGDYTRETSESAPEVILATSTNRVDPLTGVAGIPAPSAPGANPAFDNGLARYLKGLGTSYYGFDVSTPAKLTQVAQSFASPGKYSTFARYGNERVGFDNPPEGHLTAYGGSLNTDIDLAEKLHLVSITAYRRYTGDFGQSILALPSEEVRQRVTNRQFTEELRLLGSVGKWLDFTTGAFYIDSKTRNGSRIQTEGFVPAFDFLGDDPGTLRSYAFYGALDLHPIEHLTLSGGLRYSHERKTYVFNRDYTASGLAFLNSSLGGRNIDNRVNPRFSIDYRLNNQINLYASYSTGFTASAFNARPFNASGVFSLKPETVRSYEIGAKTNLFDRALTFNVAGYHTNFERLIGTVVDPTYRNGACAIFCNDNVGNAVIKGFEAELQARPVRNLLLSGNIGYTDFQYKKLLAQTSGLFLNSPNTRVPNWNLSGSIQYDFVRDNGDRIVPRIDASYRSKIHYSTDLRETTAVQQPFALVNARLSYERREGNWSLSLAATNLFNKYYFTTLADQLSGFGELRGTVGRPREWLVTLRKNF